MKYLFSFLVAVLLMVSYISPVQAQTDEVTIYFFGRDDCTHCAAEKEFFADFLSVTPGVRLEYRNVMTDDSAAALFDQVLEKHELSHVTPVTVVGEFVLQGFNAPETSGVQIAEAVEQARTSDIRTIADHLARAPRQADAFTGEGCDENGTTCSSVTNPNQYVFKLPFLGIVDLKTFSLFSLSAVLGVIDGFNPCAMWVLITFLLLLSQAGSRRKMVYVAGIFVLAEAIMYNLILNVWYQTWDFVGLDAIVTPLVGILALGGGIFFLYRWYRNREQALICDITDLETQAKTTNRIKDLITRPTTIATVFGIILIAFSVNIIEFACSIGIPQAYTKILELNGLDFLARQWYILIYTIGYMLDDLVVFAFAIWGFAQLEAHGQKYSQLSLLIGGVLMLVLGAILISNPALLVL